MKLKTKIHQRQHKTATRKSKKEKATMKSPTTVLLATVLSVCIQQVSPLSISPRERSAARHSPLFIPSARSATKTCRDRHSCTELKASTFANQPWNFIRFPSFANEKDRDVSLLSLEGGQSRVTWPNLLSSKQDVMDEKLVSEINSLSETFSDLQSSIDVKSELYETTLSTYKSQLISLQEENSFLEEGMKMLTLTLEKQADEIHKLNNEKFDKSFVNEIQEENEMLRIRVRGLEVELSDIAFESRKVRHAQPIAQSATGLKSEQVTLTPKAPSAPVPEYIVQQSTAVELSEQVQATASPEAVAAQHEDDLASAVAAMEVDLTPKAPTAPIPSHILQQRQVDELQKQLELYEQERSSLRKLFGLCFSRAARKVGKAMDLWRPVYLILADARRGVHA